MSILTGPEIIRLIKRRRQCIEFGTLDLCTGPWLDISPFDESHVGPNSYDVTLADKLLVYTGLSYSNMDGWYIPTLDTDADNPANEIQIYPNGITLYPGTLYLGSTVERTACSGFVPWLDGRSSIGRLGIQIHSTAGRGDDGFGERTPGGNTWTLEITVTHPVIVRPGLRIGQLTFFTIQGERKPYAGRYSTQDGPVASRIHLG